MLGFTNKFSAPRSRDNIAAGKENLIIDIPI